MKIQEKKGERGERAGERMNSRSGERKSRVTKSEKKREMMGEED